MDKEIKGISFPFRIGGRGGIVVSGQSIREQTHIKEGLSQLLSTVQGERVMNYIGLPPLDMFFNNLDETTKNMAIMEINETIRLYYPIIEVTDIQIVQEEQSDGGMAHVASLTYRILDSGEIESVIISV